MSEPRFTRGPWESRTEHDVLYVSGAEGFIVCTVCDYDGIVDESSECAVDEANARLIAAAPDLYAVAELARRVRETQRRYFRTHERVTLEQSLALERELDTRIAAVLDRVHGVPVQGALLGGDA